MRKIVATALLALLAGALLLPNQGALAGGYRFRGGFQVPGVGSGFRRDGLGRRGFDGYGRGYGYRPGFVYVPGYGYYGGYDGYSCDPDDDLGCQ